MWRGERSCRSRQGPDTLRRSAFLAAPALRGAIGRAPLQPAAAARRVASRTIATRVVCQVCPSPASPPSAPARAARCPRRNCAARAGGAVGQDHGRQVRGEGRRQEPAGPPGPRRRRRRRSRGAPRPAPRPPLPPRPAHPARAHTQVSPETARKREIIRLHQARALPGARPRATPPRTRRAAALRSPPRADRRRAPRAGEVRKADVGGRDPHYHVAKGGVSDTPVTPDCPRLARASTPSNA